MELVESQLERQPRSSSPIMQSFSIKKGDEVTLMKVSDWPPPPDSAKLGSKADSYWSLDLSEDLALVYFHTMFEREEDFLLKSMHNEKIGKILKGDGQCRLVGRLMSWVLAMLDV